MAEDKIIQNSRDWSMVLESDAAKLFGFEHPGSLTHRERYMLNKLIARKYVDDDPEWIKCGAEINVTFIDEMGSEIKEIIGSYEVEIPNWCLSKGVTV